MENKRVNTGLKNTNDDDIEIIDIKTQLFLMAYFIIAFALMWASKVIHPYESLQLKVETLKEEVSLLPRTELKNNTE